MATYTRYDSGITVTSNNATHGTLANVDDDNPATTCAVTGENPQYFFFVMDLGSSKPVDRVTTIDIVESGSGPDSGFTIRYSDSPLNSGNVGTVFATFGTAVTNVAHSEDWVASQITARYWGVTQAAGGANWSTVSLTLGDFNLYLDTTPATVTTKSSAYFM